MSDGAAQNGATQAASTGEAAVVASGATVATSVATAAAQGAAAPASIPGTAAVAAPAPVAHVHAGHAAAAAPAVVEAVPAPAKGDADCKPKKVAAKDDDDKVPGDDEDQNLSQPADGCVLPVPDGQAAAAPAAPMAEATPMADDGEGGGISSGLLIGAGVLAAIGVGVLALGKDNKDKNAAPVANADTLAVAEGAAVVNGSVATNDSDPNNDPLTFTLTGTAPAGLTFNPNGSFTFDANNAAYNALVAGATQVISVPYSVADGKGGTATSTLTITVTGTNDVPTATAGTATATEGSATAVTGTLAATDADTGQTGTLVFSLPTPVAGLTVNPNGTFSFNPADPAYNGLAAGQTQAVVANVRVTDASGGVANTTLTITVTGTNDAPVAVATTVAGNEDTVISGTVSASDPDAGAVLAFSVVGTAPAGFTLNSTTGAFTLDANNAAYQNLTQGQVLNVPVTVQVSDGTATTTTTVTIAVTGRAETANLDIDSDNNLNTVQVFNAGTTDFGFTDDDDVANRVRIDGFGADDFITFDAPFSGTGAVSFTNGDFDGGGTPNDLRITTNKGGVVSDIIIANVVDPTAVVFSEATADAAVAGTDNFRTTTQSATPTAVSLDVDNDSNTTSRFTIATIANTGTFNFTDSATFANTVLVRDFGGDDTLTFNTAQANVSFTSGDFDADNIADDVRITVNNAGTVSDIVLTNAVAANAVVTSFASAEAAIGAGVANFVFNGTVITPPAPPPAGTTVANLDIDTDNNLNTYRVFDAGTDGFRFTDDADTANSVEIINFGTNDRIVLEAGNTYSFTNTARDADGIANDLRITINKGGTVSDIYIKDVVDPSGVVFNEATAEQALNTRFGSGNVDYFSFA